MSTKKLTLKQLDLLRAMVLIRKIWFQGSTAYVPVADIQTDLPTLLLLKSRGLVRATKYGPGWDPSHWELTDAGVTAAS